MIDTLIYSASSHLVQSTLFAAAAALLTLAFRANKAQVRFWLWLSASIKFLIPFALLSMVGSHIGKWAPPSSVEASRAAVSTFLAAGSSHSSGETLEGAGSFAGAPAFDRSTLFMVLASVWLCGVVCVALIRLRGWMRIRRV